MIIDNVNNLSGAPLVAHEIARALGTPIVCIRTEPQVRYAAQASGIASRRTIAYFSGTLLLLLRPRFWLLWSQNRTIICNTCLTFVFAVLGRLCGKHVICVLHESFPKNLLYRLGIAASRRAAHLIVTPSRAAYLDLHLPERKWRMVPNTLPQDYFRDIENIASDNGDFYALFVGGGRAYKGGALFAQARAMAPSWLHLHEAGSAEYAAHTGGGAALGPAIYARYHFVLVLTDNRLWRETFGLIGCEAAACGALPVFTDRFAYLELWALLADRLYQPEYDATSLIERLTVLATDRTGFENLRHQARAHARELCNPERFAAWWNDAAGTPS